MGSASAPLELTFGDMLSNDWEVAGNFMYPKTAPASLAGLVASGLLDLAPVRLRRVSFSRLLEAITAATSMRDLDLTAVEPGLPEGEKPERRGLLRHGRSNLVAAPSAE